ncbi:hypothetical protein EW146_g5998 [Bondarzewia mesenterica]|uniref:C2H2-type domain-containing protein n=1 Tax=Bondarzewia mesenterica TaxID=1095465 RepID=A0A4S4LVJ0_9AGAM|nr:hypothetical protein EW146_g5998 [Bondarzewia mesenterica]
MADDHQGDNIPTYDYAIPSDGPSNLNSSQKLYVSDATHLDYANKNPYATVQGKVVDDFGTSFGNASSNATGFNSSDNSILDPTDWSTPDQDNGRSTSLGYFDEPQPSDLHPTDADIMFSGSQEPNGNLSGTCDFSAPTQYPVSPTSAGSYEGSYVNHCGYVSAPTVHTADWSVNGNSWTRDGTTYPAHADIIGENASFPFIPADAGAHQLWNAATSNPNQNLYFNGTTPNGAPNPGTMYAPAPLVDPFVPPLPAAPPSTDAAHSSLGTGSRTTGFGFSSGLSGKAVNGRKVFQSLANGKRNASVAFDNEASNTNLWTPASDGIGPMIEMWEQQMAMMSVPGPANWDEVHNNVGSKTMETQGTTSPEGPLQAAAGHDPMISEQRRETLPRSNNTYKIEVPGEYNLQSWSNLGTVSSAGEGSSILAETRPPDVRHCDDDKANSKKPNTRRRARKENEQPDAAEQPKKKQKREKTLFCLKCGEGFTTVSDLKRHERQVEDGEKIVCEYCHRSYSRDTPRHLATKVCRAARAALAQRVQEEKGREMLEQIWIDLEGLMER